MFKSLRGEMYFNVILLVSFRTYGGGALQPLVADMSITTTNNI